MKNKIFFFILCKIFFIGIISDLYAQVSVNVLSDNYVYRDIDKLIAHGLVKKIIVGQKPFSRKEVARITAEALHNLPRLEEKLQDPKLSEKSKQGVQKRLDYLQPILERLKKDYHEELVQLGALEGEKYNYSWHVLEKTTVDLTGSNSQPRLLNNNNGLGEINAIINPLLQYQQGRHLIEGTNFSLETSHWARLTDYFAFYFQPRFQMAMAPDDGQANDNNLFVMNLYGKFNIENFEIQVGRDNLFWGQGLNAGLLLSNNSRGLDMVKLSNDSPFFFPWVFKYLGANKITFFLANLGPEQNFPYAYLAGYKWSLQPLSFLEIGAALAVQSGGQNSPSATLLDRVRDLFPFEQVESNTQVQIGNKLAGLDMKFRIPPLRGIELYLEAIFDDNNANLHAQFLQEAGYIGGLYLPRLINSGELDLRIEYHKTGNRYYRHGQFTSGWTENQYILGDVLGPDAHGVYLQSNWDINSKDLLTFQGAFESRSNDTWNISPDFVFYKVQDFPDERRYRIGSEWLHRFESFPLDIKMKAAYENVQNFNFAAGNTKNNFLGQLNFQFNFDQWTRSLKN